MHCCCLDIKYIVYKYFDRSLNVGSLDPTYVQNVRSVPLMVFEILGFKLKSKNNNECEKLTFCHISTKILVHIHIDLGYHSVVLKWE